MRADSKLAAMTLRWRKRRTYSRLRQYFPMTEPKPIDDRDVSDDADIVTIDWPSNLPKPRCGIVQDREPYHARWTKYRRFLDNNGFEYGIYNIHACDWLAQAQDYDVIVGSPSSEFWDLEETRKKYHFIETYLGKATYPSAAHMMLYEDKELEAYIGQAFRIPFAKTYVSHDRSDARRLIETLQYPVVSKTFPSSGSIGVELVHSVHEARRIVEQAFSNNGRVSHLVALRQKNCVYFQQFVPNDGYDLKVIVVGKRLFGFFRKAPKGDFRASGMNLIERRELPEDAMRVALQANRAVKSPALGVDVIRGLDGLYRIIEMSPITQVRFRESLRVDGIPGVYVADEGGSFRFEPGRYWVDELALREFLIQSYLPGQHQDDRSLPIIQEAAIR